MTDFCPDLRDPQSNQAEFTVSELSSALKRTVEDSYRYIRVRGEISGFKRAASGHLYMTLKDESAVIDGVCWKGVAGRLSIIPEDGLEVIVSGKITTYAARSKYQIVIEQMEVAGEGALLKLLEDRRKKLTAEGLFDPDRKQNIPYLPSRIGVVTSPTGAVIRDILQRLTDRYPRPVVLWPVLVQGESAAQQLAAAINGFNNLPKDGPVVSPDLIIVARGGGSLEDLWAFNEEIVVRAVAASTIPIISAVGHETDTTLIDFASDKRAATPTAAAEMAVPVRTELQTAVMDLSHRQFAAMARQIEEKRVRTESLGRLLPDLTTVLAGYNQRLDSAIERLFVAGGRMIRNHNGHVSLLSQQIKPPQQIVLEGERRLTRESQSLSNSVQRFLKSQRDRLKASGDLLESLSFQRIVERGFTVIWDKSGNPITSATAAEPGKTVIIEFADGKRGATIAGADGKKDEPVDPSNQSRKKKPSKGKKKRLIKATNISREGRQGELL